MHCTITTNGTLLARRAVEGTRVVRELRHERETKAPLLVINCSITPYSYERVEEMVDIARELGDWTLAELMSNPMVPGNSRANASATGKPTYPNPTTAIRSVICASPDGCELVLWLLNQHSGY